jgi:hypothetical protein
MHARWVIWPWTRISSLHAMISIYCKSYMIVLLSRQSDISSSQHHDINQNRSIGGTPLTDPAPSRGPRTGQPMTSQSWPSHTISLQTWYETLSERWVRASGDQAAVEVCLTVSNMSLEMCVGVSGTLIGAPWAGGSDVVLSCAPAAGKRKEVNINQLERLRMSLSSDSVES